MTKTTLPLFPVAKKGLLIFLFCSGLFSVNAFGQTALPGSETARQNQPNTAMLAHYTLDELADLQTSDSLKYKSIFYYYTQSFIIEPFDCTDCVNAAVVSSFDVSKYEEFRMPSVRYTRVFDKYGFKLTLLSVDELVYKLPIHQNP